MSAIFASVLFLILIGGLAVLLFWEYRRMHQLPRLSEAARRQLLGTPMPYTPPPDRRARSLDRVRTA